MNAANDKSQKPSSNDAPVMSPRTGRALVIALVATVALTALDLGTKAWAEGDLSAAPISAASPVCEPDDAGRIMQQRVATRPVVVVEGFFEFKYAENCGAAFGMMRSLPTWVRRIVFGAAAVAASLGLFFLFARGNGGRFFAYSVPLIVSGALGNLVDRIRYGYVVDFIRFYGEALGKPTWEYPTFNVADIGITVGVIFLLIDGFLDARAQKAAGREEGAESAEQAGA